jgi:predicted DNA-binding protein
MPKEQLDSGKYYAVRYERLELEEKLDELVENWKNGKTTFSSEDIEKMVDEGYLKMDQLKKIEEKEWKDYLAQIKKEEMKKKADTNISYFLGTRPSDSEIIGGIAAPKGSPEGSYLIGQKKTSEQLEKEKNQLLNTIENKIRNKEISLEIASKLKDDINIAYGYYEKAPEKISNDNGMNR